MGVTRPTVVALAMGGAVLLAACSSAPSPPSDVGLTGDADVTGDVIVFAAASLTEAFTELAGQFETQHPGTRVVVNLAGSSSLAQQVAAGAPADVLATASTDSMQLVLDEGLADEVAVLARNRLEIAVPAGNPGGVTGLADLADEDLVVALCADQVPCGAAAVRLLNAAGVTAAPDTLEEDARATLAKVRLGEVDAALVYRTDVLAAGSEVEGITVPEAAGHSNEYPVAVLEHAPNPAAAEAFVELALSEAGREVLGAAGFDLP
jgi:molybdate transport system substrate-binding protein